MASPATLMLAFPEVERLLRDIADTQESTNEHFRSALERLDTRLSEFIDSQQQRFDRLFTSINETKNQSCDTAETRDDSPHVHSKDFEDLPWNEIQDRNAGPSPNDTLIPQQMEELPDLSDFNGPPSSSIPPVGRSQRSVTFGRDYLPETGVPGYQLSTKPMFKVKKVISARDKKRMQLGDKGVLNNTASTSRSDKSLANMPPPKRPRLSDSNVHGNSDLATGRSSQVRLNTEGPGLVNLPERTMSPAETMVSDSPGRRRLDITKTNGVSATPFDPSSSDSDDVKPCVSWELRGHKDQVVYGRGRSELNHEVKQFKEHSSRADIQEGNLCLTLSQANEFKGSLDYQHSSAEYGGAPASEQSVSYGPVAGNLPPQLVPQSIQDILKQIPGHYSRDCSNSSHTPANVNKDDDDELPELPRRPIRNGSGPQSLTQTRIPEPERATRDSSHNTTKSGNVSDAQERSTSASSAQFLNDVHPRRSMRKKITTNSGPYVPTPDFTSSEWLN